MYILTHPSHAQDLGKVKASKAEIVDYLGSEELFNQFVTTGLIYADNTTKDKSTDTKSKPEPKQSNGGNK